MHFYSHWDLLVECLEVCLRGFVSELLGRKVALMLGGIPFLTGWIFIANAVQITQSRLGFLVMLFAGRMLIGFGAGWFMPSASVSTYFYPRVLQVNKLYK